MGREGTVDQPAWIEQPTHAIGLHDKWVFARVRIEANPIGLCRCVRGLVGREVWYIVAGPLLSIPPDPLLALAPGVARGIGRGTVVHHPPVGWPGPTPVEVGAHDSGRVGLLAGGEVLVRGGEDTAVDPGRAGGGAIILQRTEAGEVASCGGLVAVDLFKNLQRLRLSGNARRLVRLVVPNQMLETLVSRQ